MPATATRTTRQPAPQADAFLAALANPVTARILDANITTRMLLAGPAACGDADMLHLIDGAMDALKQARLTLVAQRARARASLVEA